MIQGEHGTGRNVAPYVEMEWGTKAYELMWRLKELFDPDYVLNPGVILNRVCAPTIPAIPLQIRGFESYAECMPLILCSCHISVKQHP